MSITSVSAITNTISQQLPQTLSSESNSYPLSNRCSLNLETLLMYSCVAATTFLAIASFIAKAYMAGAFLTTIGGLLLYSNRNVLYFSNETGLQSQILALQKENQELLIEKQKADAIAAQLRSQNANTVQDGRQSNQTIPTAQPSLELSDTHQARQIADLTRQLGDFQEAILSISNQVIFFNRQTLDASNPQGITIDFEQIKTENEPLARTMIGTNLSFDPDVVELNHQILNQQSLTNAVIQALIKQKDELTAKLTDLQQNQTIAPKHQQELEKLKNQIVERHNEFNNLQKQIQDARATLMKDAIVIKAQRERALKEVLQLSTTQQELVTAIGDLTHQKKEVESEVAKIILKKSTLNESLIQIATSSDNQADQQIITNKLAYIQTDLEGKHTDLQALEHQLNVSNRESETLMTKIESERNNLKQLEAAIKEQTDCLNRKTRDFNEIDQKLEQLLDTIEQLDKKKTQLTSDIQELEKQKALAELNDEQLKTAAESQKTYVDQKNREFEVAVALIEKKWLNMGLKTKEMEEKIAQLNSEIQRLEQQKNLIAVQDEQLKKKSNS